MDMDYKHSCDIIESKTKSWEWGGKIVNTLTEVMVGIGARGQSGMDGRYGCPDTDNQLACYDPGYLCKPLLNVKLHYHDRELSTNYLGH